MRGDCVGGASLSIEAVQREEADEVEEANTGAFHLSPSIIFESAIGIPTCSQEPYSETYVCVCVLNSYPEDMLTYYDYRTQGPSV